MRRSRRRSVRPLLCGLWLVTLLLPFSLLFATQVRQIGLAEMSQRAATIFSGRCVELRVEQHPVLEQPITVAVFEVDRVVKGDLDGTVTLRMYGGSPPAVADAARIGSPQFREGEEVVLFLYAESEFGLTSPIGLAQGKFSVVEDKQGRKIALNAFGNKNLERDLPPGALESVAAAGEPAQLVRGLEPNVLLDLVASLLR